MRLHTLYIFSIIILFSASVFGQGTKSGTSQVKDTVGAKSDTTLLGPTKTKGDEEEVEDIKEQSKKELDGATKNDKVQKLDSAQLQRLANDTLKIKSNYRFGVDIWADYGKLLMIPSNIETKWEGGIGLILFKRVELLAEYGYGKLTPGSAFKNVESYTSEGNYYRVGLGYIVRLSPATFYTFGAMYGQSNFEDHGKPFINSQYWNDYGAEFSSKNLSASWYEFIVSSESELKKVKNLFLGMNIRLRAQNQVPTREPIDIYAIPGYGRTFDKTIPALNLYVKYYFHL